MNKKGAIIIIFILTIIVFKGCQGKPGIEERRGIVLFPSDIISMGSLETIEILSRGDLNLLGIHANPVSVNPEGGYENLPALRNFLESKEGELLLAECKKRGIDVEYETHALQEILPRKLFDEHPGYFRMDEKGVRQKDFNMCFHSEDAYLEIEKSIKEITEWMKPTTHRYFFWTDDNTNSFCHCDLCSPYTESEQALIYENKLLEILQKYDHSATIAHLAYHNTLKAPVKVKPAKGVFLEFAPISRDYSTALSDEQKQDLKENLLIFPKSTAHILEYWLDASMHSGWNRENLRKVPWNAENCYRDIIFYSVLGIKSITTFGTWMLNDVYIKRYGKDDVIRAVGEYGGIFKTVMR
jgi:hypothetical protein